MVDVGFVDVDSVVDGGKPKCSCFFVLSVLVAMFFVIMYFVWSSSQWSLAESIYNQSLSNVVGFVSDNVSSQIINDLIFYTNNCSAVNVSYLNGSRQLVDVACLQGGGVSG